MTSPATQTTTRHDSSWDHETYRDWIATQGIPIHEGYFIADLRTLELGWWEARGCNAAFLLLAGQEGVSEARVTEVPPGGTTKPARMGLDEVVYVVEGRGITSIWANDQPVRSFEWQKQSLFRIPANYHHQYANTIGDRPARLLHYNALPLGMMVADDAEFFFSSNYVNLDLVYGEAEPFSEAKLVEGTGSRGTFWRGNFFPDMGRWDKFLEHGRRGAGAQIVWIQYPNAPLWNHMSIFPDRTYKKAHRHGPGTLIVIPSGEGFSFMWPEGKEKIYIPWGEASVFVPPNNWYHQHFNVGQVPARYLAFHSPRANNDYEERRLAGNQQIEYVDEDPVVRTRFEDELAKRGLQSLMPPEVFVDKYFGWEEPEGGA